MLAFPTRQPIAAVTTPGGKAGPSQTSRKNVWQREALLGDAPVLPRENNVVRRGGNSVSGREWTRRGTPIPPARNIVWFVKACIPGEAVRSPKRDHCCSRRVADFYLVAVKRWLNCAKYYVPYVD